MDLSDRSQRFRTVAGPRARPRASGAPRDSEAVRRAVRAFQAGTEREESFRVLFDTYGSTVQGFFARRLGSTETARDLTQETFLRVYRGLEGYRGEAPFGAWLFRIARNVLGSRSAGRAAARLRAREVRIEDVETQMLEAREARDETASEGVPRALASVLEEERRRVLATAVERLPPQRRRCIVLWAYHELAYREIAVVLQLSIGTVKAHLAQAREQLLELVEETTREPER